jgi:hypothetical protein
MPNLTAQQANDLSSNFLGLPQAIGDFRYDNWSTLTKEDNQNLGNLQWSILNYGEDILALSATLVMAEVEGSLAQINSVTQQIKGTIDTLQKVQKALNVAASIVTLGGAIISKNPKAIAGGIQGVVDAWKA